MVIAGGSGFLGASLATHLAAGGTPVVILSRTAPKVGGPWLHVARDGRTLGEWRRELDGAAGPVNLAGRRVDCIKTWGAVFDGAALPHQLRHRPRPARSR